MRFIIVLFFIFLNISFAVNNNKVVKNEAIISTIEIDGNRIIDESIILGHLTFGIGDMYISSIINDSVKKLYETGFFENIDINFDKNTLTIYVNENPVIEEVVFEGNDAIDEKTLENEVFLKRRNIFDKNKLNGDTKRILTLYKRLGRFSTKVVPKIIKDEENYNRIKLVFEIEEGNAVKIENIDFVGNKVYSSSKLKSQIRSKEWKWFKFGMGATYDPDMFEVDKEFLRRFYFINGYPDFEVLSLSADLSVDQKEVYMTILINEGEKYFFGDIELVNNIKKIDNKKLQKKVKSIKKGKTFNSELIQKTMDNLNIELAKEGYVFVDIIPEVSKGANNTMNIKFIINESLKMYVGKINIIGNTRTVDRIIREKMRLWEGDPLNMVNVNSSIYDLYNTGYFDKVDIKKDHGEIPDTVDLTIEVQERRTGELRFGVGYSTYDGANINVGIKEDNLLGRGQSLGIDVLYAKYSKNISLNYGKPNFLGRDLYAGVNIFYREDKDRDSVDYRQEKYGGGTSFSYNITDDLKQRVFYTAYQDKITNVVADLKDIVRVRDDFVSIIGQTLYIDLRDNRLNTTKGFYTSWTLEFAGLGGDKHYIRNTINANLYIPIYEDLVSIKIGGYAGSIKAINGNYLEINDVFYLNSNIIRGFKYAGIGPRLNTGIRSSLGGKDYYVGITELKFPFGIPKEYNVFAGLFINAGSLYNTDVKKYYTYPENIDDNNSIRSAYGITIYWTTPMGLLNFTFSKVINREDYDIPEEFNFNFGTNF
jgi:outer membrane protein insertion porin family